MTVNEDSLFLGAILAISVLIGVVLFLDHRETMAQIAAGNCKVQTDGFWEWKPCRAAQETPE